MSYTKEYCRKNGVIAFKTKNIREVFLKNENDKEILIVLYLLCKDRLICDLGVSKRSIT